MSARAQSARGYRMRPAPRSRSRRGGGTRVNWDKVGRVALVLVLVAVLASYVSPALNFLDSWKDSKTEHANLAQLKQENEQLRERIATLGQPEQAERAARKNGMVGETEGPYVVHGLRR